MAKAKKKEESSSVDISNFGDFVDDLIEQSDRITETDPSKALRWLSAYSVPINLALSGHPEKGVPMGRMINFEGESDTGKTLLALTMMRETQQTYGSMFRGLVIDTERGIVPSRCEDMGLFVKKKPKNSKKPVAEDGEDTTGDPRAGTFKVIQTTDLTVISDKILPRFLAQVHEHPEFVFILLIDSVSMIVTTHEREAEFDTKDMARALELRKFMRLLNDGYSENLTVFLVHHHSARIATGGKQLTTKQGSHANDIAGGKAMKFVPSVRIEIGYGGKDYEETGKKDAEGKKIAGKILGQKCRIEVIKSRLFRPMIKAEVVIDHNCGFTQLNGLFDQLVQMGVVIEDGNKWICPSILGKEKFWLKDIEPELEKPENAVKVVEQIVKRMTFANFGDKGNSVDDGDDKEDKKADLEDLEK